MVTHPLPSPAWTREITPPWRRGVGVAIPWPVKRLVTVGVWLKGKAPSDEPVTYDVDTEVIRSW